MPIGLYGPEYIQFSNGGPAAEVAIFVFLPGTTVKAQLYADKSGLYTGPNPSWTDRRGELVFFAEIGSYDLVYELKDGVLRFPVQIAGNAVVDVDTYVHVQNLASDIWVVTHDLGVKPSVIVEENVGIPDDISYPAIRHLSNSSLQLRWGYNASGRATCRR